MSEHKHTPGPWYVSDLTLHGCRLVYAPDGRMVADAGRIHRRTDEEMDANAHLIAAAPDLLAACEVALEAAKAVYEANDESPDALTEVMYALSRAIAAARGEVEA